MPFLLHINRALQGGLPLFLGARKQKERPPHEHQLQQEADRHWPQVAVRTRPRAIAIVPGDARAACHATQEGRKADKRPDEPLGYEGCALEAQDEAHKLELVGLVKHEENEEEPCWANAVDRNQRDQAEQPPPRITHFPPEALVERKQVVAEKGPKAVHAPPLHVWRLVRPVKEDRRLQQDFRAEVRPCRIDETILRSGDGPRHLLVFERILRDRRNPVHQAYDLTVNLLLDPHL
mmetsp:Transcript_132912/g.384269  ORF Transcript_132912/g.384269 Transcript_132912/m.384269 type:complete len:235 (-) Transcript_132912:267-971(-)